MADDEARSPPLGERGPESSARIDKVEAALRAGQLWRAKEILSGRIGSGTFTPDIYEQLGSVLLQMGDQLQAGRFLFLSGARRPEYASAIDLFLRRFSRAGWQSLLASFPASARRASWSDLPPNVLEALRAAGVPERPEAETIWSTYTKDAADQLQMTAGGCVGAGIALLVTGLLVAYCAIKFIET